MTDTDTPHQLRIYMKSGNQIDIQVASLEYSNTRGVKSLNWESLPDQTVLKLLHVDMDQVEGIVRLS